MNVLPVVITDGGRLERDATYEGDIAMKRTSLVASSVPLCAALLVAAASAQAQLPRDPVPSSAKRRRT